ncbi:G2/mitotic-specific cyclin-B, partial [Sarcoptes scabiei]
IANLKSIKASINDENAVDKNNIFRSKIPVLKARIGCQENVENVNKISKNVPLKSCKPVINNKPIETKLKLKPVIENIDNESNCFLLSEYAPEIYRYLHSLEVRQKQALKPNFLSINPLVTPNMRAILVDWMVGVHRSFRMFPETLYLSISIVDRILSKEKIEKNQLQLLGAAALFVAAKFEEVYYPDVKDFVVICDNSYTKREILQMEIKILTLIDFELSGPCPLHFLRRGSKAASADSQAHLLGKYLCELSAIDYQCASWLPSLKAATALYLALKLIKAKEIDGIQNLDENSLWTPTIEHYTGYSLNDVRKNSTVISRLIVQAETSKLQNCRKKYKSSKFMNISEFAEGSIKIINRKSPIA